MTHWKRGDLVELDGLLAVVVGVEGDENVPEDHTLRCYKLLAQQNAASKAIWHSQTLRSQLSTSRMVWFGEPACVRRSKGGSGGQSPLVYTIPADYFTSATPPTWKH